MSEHHYYRTGIPTVTYNLVDCVLKTISIIVV